nr:MAG TPA: hypothetical protein [Caudoviricetes sp.]
MKEMGPPYFGPSFRHSLPRLITTTLPSKFYSTLHS